MCYFLSLLSRRFAFKFVLALFFHFCFFYSVCCKNEGKQVASHGNSFGIRLRKKRRLVFVVKKNWYRNYMQSFKITVPFVCNFLSLLSRIFAYKFVLSRFLHINSCYLFTLHFFLFCSVRCRIPRDQNKNKAQAGCFGNRLKKKRFFVF